MTSWAVSSYNARVLSTNQIYHLVALLLGHKFDWLTTLRYFERIQPGLLLLGPCHQRCGSPIVITLSVCPSLRPSVCPHFVVTR